MNKSDGLAKLRKYLSFYRRCGNVSINIVCIIDVTSLSYYTLYLARPTDAGRDETVFSLSLRVFKNR